LGFSDIFGIWGGGSLTIVVFFLRMMTFGVYLLGIVLSYQIVCSSSTYSKIGGHLRFSFGDRLTWEEQFVF